MPIIENSTYQPPRFLTNGHLSTIYPSLFRKVTGVTYQRERMETPDDDFLDLDWSRIGSGKIGIVSHGLEGDTNRGYMLGMVKALNAHGWDALAWNYRSCSGEPNRLLRSYHSGATDDLHIVAKHVIGQNCYREIALIGFSLGGNITLKYLGENGQTVDPLIKKGVAFSVPCDLARSSVELAKFSNIIYMRRFLQSLHEKVKRKKALMPDKIDDTDFHKIKDFRGFDDRYTAPFNGFRDAEDYWQQCSSRQFIPNISVPTLLVSARNDPFLSPECFPVEEAKNNPNFYIEIPAAGGHVGFTQFNGDGLFWSEKRALQFLNEA